ncbi:hypothetical protein UFOVP60_12 [uncultured Caudovirales phage]|uniref:Uncharacterized protein n=1 Tax=uncultured Caudovirales phage TaxID=2100421 RepID=A0A6J5T9A0_9CAUD|nr:hypothetical protein UFOVP60_12 [uncultured Caudovirales phage]
MAQCAGNGNNMRADQLLTPGVLTNGLAIRNEVAQAISQIQIVAARTPGGKVQSANTLAAFLLDAASKLTALKVV